MKYLVKMFPQDRATPAEELVVEADDVELKLSGSTDTRPEKPLAFNFFRRSVNEEADDQTVALIPFNNVWYVTEKK